MKHESYFRNSTNEWVYTVECVTPTTNYVFRYSNRFRLLAWFEFMVCAKADIKGLGIYLLNNGRFMSR